MNLLTVSFGTNNSNAPTIDEKTLNKAQYVYFDTDNLFPQRMVALADNCPIHSAAIQKHAFFIAGDGVEFEDETKAEACEKYLKERLGDVRQFLSATAVDRAYFNGHNAAFQYTKGGELFKVKHVDFSTIRSGKTLKEGEPIDYWYSPDWKNATNKRSFTDKYINIKPQEFKSFRANEKKRGVMIMYSRTYKPSKLYYPEPEYLAAIKYIQTDIELSRYIDGLTKKGFRAGTHIHLYKEMDDEAAKEAEKDINAKFTGDGAPDIVLTFGGSPESAPAITNLPAFTNAEILTTVGKELDKKIDSAHPIPSMLYTSFETASGLDGQANAIKEVIEYYQNTAVRTHQAAIEETLNAILEQGGFDNRCMIKAVNPVSFMVDKSIMLRVLTSDEIRQEIGWEPMKDGKGETIPIQTNKIGESDGIRDQD